jgi:hypothetical protein
METDVERSSDSLSVSVEIPLYRGPAEYRAAVTIEVSTAQTETQGGTIPGVPVTITSDTTGTVSFDYSSGGETLAGSVSWSCSR